MSRPSTPGRGSGGIVGFHRRLIQWMKTWQDSVMKELTNRQLLQLDRIRRRQALRFGVPVLVFLLMLALLGAALVLSRQDEREQFQAKLIADTLWARQNLQYQASSLMTSLEAYLSDPEIYGTPKFRAAIEQTARAYPEMIAAYHGKGLEAVDFQNESKRDAASIGFDRMVREHTLSRLNSGLDGYMGPLQWQRQHYVALLLHSPDGKNRLVAIVDLAVMLEKQLPWWFTQENQVDLLDGTGNLLTRLVKTSPSAGVYQHTASLEFGGLPLQMLVGSIRQEPRLFNYGVTVALAGLMLMLSASFLMLWRDSRRRLEIEAKLEEEKLFRQSMQDSMAVGLRVWDLSGVIRYVNPAFCRIVGYTPEELIGAPQPLPYWPSRHLAEYKLLVAKVISGNTPKDGFETVYQHKNGKLIDVLIVEAPLKDVKGVQTGWMSSVIDITDRKRNEALIAEQREKLAAASRFALVGEVASNIAHELNQPLASMVSFAQAGINMCAKGEKAETFAKLFEKLRDQAQRAGRVVGSVQNLVRRRQPQRERVKIGDMVESIEGIVKDLAAKHSVELVWEIHDRDMPLHLDRIMLEQSLVNLVKNATEAFQSSQKIRTVWLITKLVGDSVHFLVRDNGPGLQFDNMEKMFESLVSTKPDGLGLGLSLCRSVAEAHGGRLQADLVPTGGTAFILSLPMAMVQVDEENHV